jgi:hypothetical protein
LADAKGQASDLDAHAEFPLAAVALGDRRSARMVLESAVCRSSLGGFGMVPTPHTE